MQFDLLLLRVDGPSLKPNEYMGIRYAAVVYLKNGGTGPGKFSVEELDVEGYLEKIGVVDRVGLSGVKFRADIGTESGILRIVEFIIPWNSVDVEINEESFLLITEHGDGSDDDTTGSSYDPPRILN